MTSFLFGRIMIPKTEISKHRLEFPPFFGSIPATELDSRLLARYIDRRREEQASNATINRELACLKRMYRLASRSTPPRVPSVPNFPHLKETNVRQGFVTPEQFAKLVAHCSDLWLQAMLETAYNYGWRVSELLNLRVGQVDLVGRTIRLEPGTTKNHEGREVTIESGRLLELLCQCVEGKRPEDHVFTRGDKPIRDFRKRWENLCTAAGGCWAFSSMICAGRRHETCVLPACRRKSSCALQDGKPPASSSDTRS